MVLHALETAAGSTFATGEAGVMFDLATGVLTFNSAFDGTLTFDVTAIDDSTPDSGETVELHLVGGSATITNGTATITDGNAVVTITDLDQAVSFDLDAAPASISEEAPGTATFTLAMSGGPLNGSNTATGGGGIRMLEGLPPVQVDPGVLVVGLEV